MTRTLLVGSVILAIVTVTSGMIYGRLSNRWGSSEELRLAGELLNQLPAESFGDWAYRESSELSEGAATTLECTGHTARTYVNRKDPRQLIKAFVLWLQVLLDEPHASLNLIWCGVPPAGRRLLLWSLLWSFLR